MAYMYLSTISNISPMIKSTNAVKMMVPTSTAFAGFFFLLGTGNTPFRVFVSL
jgi:hypothetical protein